ncbi:hypothetical protein N7478_000788 [Penicillium angulare]|uniref:uncharacterized protein n=1 Tax=Penicillium angulare TaxID=116970 RepID=UPI00254010A7|nr:uncharacterized protein N7478_000788 [Penicillium angulare]KAJ5291537.1 hypothetical protein N7478_000788 [Penicillium angulare]
MAKVLLDDCGADINASWHGSTALMLACENRDWKAVDFLLSESTIDITLRNENDETAMDIAIRNGASAIVKRFLTMDLDLQDTGHKVPFPLRHAFDNEQYYIFQLILSDPRTTMDEKARLNLKRTFHAAVRDGDCIAAEMILSLDTAQLALVSLQGEYALHEVVQSYRNGLTALTIASSRDFREIVLKLLQHTDIEIDATDHWGRTALWYGAAGGNLDIVQDLCAHPQISRNIADHAGHTAQSIARQHENFDVSDFLGKLDSGASKSKEPQ